MLKIDKSAKEQFEKAKELARKLGLTSQLAKQLRWLQEYACHGKPVCRVILYRDFAPYSFSIVWQKRLPKTPGREWDKEDGWKHWFNGGLIFHGPHDNGGDGGAPTFSVNLTPHHGWSIHT